MATLEDIRKRGILCVGETDNAYYIKPDTGQYVSFVYKMDKVSKHIEEVFIIDLTDEEYDSLRNPIDNIEEVLYG